MVPVSVVWPSMLAMSVVVSSMVPGSVVVPSMAPVSVCYHIPWCWSCLVHLSLWVGRFP